QLLHVAPRADARLRQDLVQLGRVRLGTQYALVRRGRPLGRRLLLGGGIEGARDDFGEHLARIGRRQRLDDVGLRSVVIVVAFSGNGEGAFCGPFGGIGARFAAAATAV